MGYNLVYVQLELLHLETQAFWKSRHGVYRIIGEQSQKDWKIPSAPRSTDSKTKPQKEILLKRRTDWKPLPLAFSAQKVFTLGNSSLPHQTLRLSMCRCFKLGNLTCESNTFPILKLAQG